MSANGDTKFGLFVPQGWKMDLVEIADPVEQYEAMTRVARAADGAAWDSIWVYDHFHTTPTPELETTFEAWMITAGLLRDTKHVNVGQMVTCNGYRNPALLAKMASTADVMGQGRLYFGLGAGWYEHEWRAYGYGFPETRERMGRFREACEIISRMWTEDYPVFEGKYYTIDKPINEPRGVRKPHPSFWIGGGGEQVTLKLVARWANACNLGNRPLDQISHKLEVLRQHCDALGRNYDEIIRSASVDLVLLRDEARAEQETASWRGRQSHGQFVRNKVVGNADRIAEYLQGFVDAGINYLIIYIPGVAYDQEPVHHFAAEVIPRFSAS